MKFLYIIFLVVATAPFATPQSENYTLINSTNLAMPRCKSRCGNLTVPYPFGIGVGSNCSMNPMFDVYCSTDFPYKAYIPWSLHEIKNISDSRIRISNEVPERCYNTKGGITNYSSVEMNFTNTPYTISEINTLTVIGCKDYAWISAQNSQMKSVSTGCMAICSEAEEVKDGKCLGRGCCQIPIPNDLVYYKTRLRALQNTGNNRIRSFNPCTYAFLGEHDVFKFQGALDFQDLNFVRRMKATVPVVLEWTVGNSSCDEAQKSKDFACKSNSVCMNATRDSGGYHCICKQGFHGNPYLSPGCQDIDECEDNSKYPCYGNCTNTMGSFNCTCRPGSSGDATIFDGCKDFPKDSPKDFPKKFPKFPVTLFTLGMLILLVVLFVIIGLYFGIRKRKLIKMREKFFEQNGGLFLKQKIKNAQGTGTSVTIFSSEELRKATNNYSKEQIVGRGGYGIVYKGILHGNIVAVKKSKLIDVTQSEQFINEVLILTQVVHRNVVKILGCCLEDEVPLLVYEFISNNTLFHHIHHNTSWLSWENRLRVAAEAAGALSYFHSQANMPIIHRDVKSTNILLDENYNTKISDFGASRLVPLDHDQVTTLIQRTLGYLDPEYFHTSLLTDKSDVYSFGVVLAELITGQKPICEERNQKNKNLAMYFVKSMKEGRLFQIIEPRVLREGTFDQLQAVGELVKICLNQIGDDRPTMKEVSMKLEGLKKFTTHPLVNQQRHEETKSLIIEAEQLDLYSVPLISSVSYPYTEYCSGNTFTPFQIDDPDLR